MSPDGVNTNLGKVDSPIDLTTALTKDEITIVMMDGIYEHDGFALADNLSLVADINSKPIIVGTDGFPPDITVGSNCIIDGIFIGGSKEEIHGFVNFTGQNSTIQNCTFWGFGQLMGGVAVNNTIKNNRFVNNGVGALDHDIYINDSTVSPLNTLIQENIHIGGEGYKIHLYHNPEGVTIHANFMGGSIISDLAVQQNTHTITNNILWDADYQYWNAGTCVFNKNIIGVDRVAFTDIIAWAETNTADGNVFANGQTEFGTNPVAWVEADIETNLGYSKAVIDAAIQSLITKFQQTTQQIYDDATIEADFTIFKNIIDTWKGH